MEFTSSYGGQLFLCGSSGWLIGTVDTLARCFNRGAARAGTCIDKGIYFNAVGKGWMKEERGLNHNTHVICNLINTNASPRYILYIIKSTNTNIKAKHAHSFADLHIYFNSFGILLLGPHPCLWMFLPVDVVFPVLVVAIFHDCTVRWGPHLTLLLIFWCPLNDILLAFPSRWCF